MPYILNIRCLDLNSDTKAYTVNYLPPESSLLPLCIYCSIFIYYLANLGYLTQPMQVSIRAGHLCGLIQMTPVRLREVHLRFWGHENTQDIGLSIPNGHFLNNTYELWSPEKAIIPCICISWLLKIENLMLKMCVCPRLYIHTQS